MNQESKLFSLRRIAAVFGTLVFFFASQSFAQVTNRSGVDSTIFVSHTVFVPKAPYESGVENWGVDLGDIDKDGDLDVITCSNLDKKVTVHFNTGKGIFPRTQSYAAGNYNRAVVVADLNKDTWLDIATVSVSDMKVNWLLNNGSGGFLPMKSVAAGGGFPHDIQAADVNQDGFIDLVTVCNTANKVALHFGDGAGNFTGAKSFPTEAKPRSVVVADLNKDNIPDLIVGTDSRTVNYLLGTGGGNFAPYVYLISGVANWGIGVGDFDKNGALDICAADYMEDKLSIHLNTGKLKAGKMEFLPVQQIQSGDYNFDLVVGDFDLDGDLDIVTASTRDEVINVHLNDGKGVFGEKNKITSGNWNSAIVAADLDADGDLDIATSSIKDNKMNVHRNASIDPEGIPTSTCVYGTVRDKDSGDPLMAIVSVVGDDGFSLKSMKTTADGKYKFCEIPFGSGFHLVAKVKGYPKFDETFDLPESLGKEGLKKDAILEKIKATDIFGRVTDIETQLPLAGATVEIKDKNGAVVTKLTCDSDGKYRTTLPFGTNYELTAGIEGYNAKTAVVSLYPNDFPAGKEQNFELGKIKPKTTACIKGYVLEKGTGIKLADAEVKVMDAEGNTVKKVTSNAQGYYEACDVPFGTYNLAGNKKGYMYNIIEGINVTEADVANGVTQDIELVKFEVGMKIVLKNIFYDVAKATLRPESVAELDRLVRIMEQNPTLVVEIGGHTDSDGSDVYNEKLSQARSQSVVDYLLDAGIAENRLVAKGYGEKEPVAPNDTKENKQLNRRTEFGVLAF
ncbi:MAG: VCBS repeat-containing protein [Bacteroidetes bacterium]|nr:VCBS repeat-containing protein [Bacteroidota bacterium]